MLNAYAHIFLLAMLPIGELRLAIPLALTKYHLSVPEAYLVSVLGNLVPVAVLLLFLKAVSAYLISKSSLWDRFFYWLYERTRRRVITKYELYGYVALILFVAIPLPITGAWTGSVAAHLLGIPFWRAFGLIAAGVIISGILVTLASVGALAMF